MRWFPIMRWPLVLGLLVAARAHADDNPYDPAGLKAEVAALAPPRSPAAPPAARATPPRAR